MEWHMQHSKNVLHLQSCRDQIQADIRKYVI